MNRLEEFRNAFACVTPWAGQVSRGFVADFLGVLTDLTFLEGFRGDANAIGGRYVETRLPSLDNMTPAEAISDNFDWRGERWFEAVNWFVAAREARGQFVMITLGAWHGGQAVGSYRALQCLNPMPCRLVAVEPAPDNVEMVRRHFQTNGIDPDAHWIMQTAVSDRTDPVFFPIVPRLLGPQNCFSSNEGVAREGYCRDVVASGKVEDALSNLLLHNSTGVVVAAEGSASEPLTGEIKYVSAITLRELLGPFTTIDYLESDIQESEKLVFPPFMDLLRRKVRRIHIGTHGRETHLMLHDLFAREGWEIVFSYEPETVHETVLGTFRTEDGVLTVRNPHL